MKIKFKLKMCWFTLKGIKAIFCLLILNFSIYGQCTWTQTLFDGMNTGVTAPSVIASTVYGQSSCITSLPFEGACTEYMNFIDGLPVNTLVYQRNITNVCPNFPLRVTGQFATYEGAGLQCNMRIEIRDGGAGGAVLSNITTGTLPFASSYFQYQVTVTPIQNNITIMMYSMVIGSGAGNDLLFDALQIEQCKPALTVTSGSTCAGECVTLTETTNPLGYSSYTWSPSTGLSSTIGTSVSACPGTTTQYTVTGISGTCTQTATAIVTISQTPTVTVNSLTLCKGNSSVLTASGATTYSWSPSTGLNTTIGASVTASPTITTTYTVIGTTAGCTGTATSTVTVNPRPVVSVNSTTMCPGSLTTLTASGASTYIWNPATGLNITTGAIVTASTIATIIYTITGTSVAGCTSTATSTITIGGSITPTVNSPTICAGNSVALTAGGGATYTWSPAIGLSITTGTNVTANPIVTTTYTITAASGGCTGTITAVVSVNPIPILSVNSSAICPGGTVLLTATGATTYSWSTGAVTNTINVNPASTTSYTVTGTSLGCSSSTVSTVTVNAILEVSAGVNDTICYGMSTNLAVTPNGAGYSYVWTPVTSLGGITNYNPVASPTITTTYSVTVTDPSGCAGTDNVTVYVDPQMTLAISGINVICNGGCNGQSIVTPTGGTLPYSYNWNSGCLGASCTGLCPGTYTVVVTDSWGCNAVANTSVTEPTLLTVSTTSFSSTSCNGVCDGSATAAATGGAIGSGYSYSWNTVPIQTTATATGLCAGLHICTATDANGCTATTTVIITEPTTVVIAPITSVTICTGGSTTLTANANGGNSGGYFYTWLPTGTNASVNVSPATTTNYTVNAMDVVHNCPAVSVTVTVIVNPPLVVATNGATTICPGSLAVISASASLGNGGPYTYAWSPAGMGSGVSATVTPTTTSIYTVTANDGCSPAATTIITVTVLPLPIVTLNSDVTSGCEPLCVNFTNNSSVTGGTISTSNWIFDGVTSSLTNPSHCFTTSGSYNVALTVTSSIGGCTSTNTITNMIIVYPNPVASFTAPLSTSIINPIVNFTDNSTNAKTWSWNFGDAFATGTTTFSNLQNPIHNYLNVGTYCVLLTVTSIHGCTNTTDLCVVIDPEFTFYIPNAFTPNGDGINDTFFGLGTNINSYEMYIYDRWGENIFYTDNIIIPWDGRGNHGKEIAQQDVYTYLITVKDFKDKKYKYIGSVTLLK